MGGTNPKPVNPPPTIEELLNDAVPDFQQSSDIAAASPLIHLVRIKVNNPTATTSLTLLLDSNHKAIFTDSVSNDMLANSLFFKVTFQSQPGAQYDHCFIQSQRRFILFVQSGNIFTQSITNHQVHQHSIRQIQYYFHHSPDGASNDLPSNCSIHPTGTTQCSLEFNSLFEAVMGCQDMKMNIEMLGHIDVGNNWRVTVSS